MSLELSSLAGFVTDGPPGVAKVTGVLALAAATPALKAGLPSGVAVPAVIAAP
jgi:hypothetical protein